MLPCNHPDRIQIAFDDHRLVANAGLILPATLALLLGLPQLLRKRLDHGGAPGRAITGDKMMTLVASALAGGDCIDDDDVLRAVGTARVLGSRLRLPPPWAPSCAASGGAMSASWTGTTSCTVEEECLNESWSLSLEDAREKIEGWRRYYNRERPHGALGNWLRRAFALVASAGVQ